MHHTISSKAWARITTPQTLRIEGHIKKKKVQEVKDNIKKEEMNPTISCNSLVEITTPQTIKIEGHIKKKNVQEVQDHIKHQEMNPTISCKGLEEITTRQTLEIDGNIKKKKVQAVKDHIEHQQQVLQLLKDNATLVQNRMKQQVDQHRSEKCFDVGHWVFLLLHLKQAIYEKEMLAILHGLKKWQPYLMRRHFKVKMDHDSLKNFLEQILSLEEQRKWSQICWVMNLKSSTKKGRKMLLQMHSQERMRMWKHCFVLFLLSNQIG